MELVGHSKYFGFYSEMGSQRETSKLSLGEGQIVCGNKNRAGVKGKA